MGNPANWLVNRKQTCPTGPLEYKYQVIFLLVLGATCTQRRAVDNKILGIIEWGNLVPRVSKGGREERPWERDCEWGWVGYKEFCRSRRVLSTEALRDLQNSSYPTKAEFNNYFIIHSKYFLVLKGVSPFLSLFFRSQNITQPCPQVFSINGSIICSGLHFWRHFDVIDSIWQRFFPIWRTAAGYGGFCVWF